MRFKRNGLFVLIVLCSILLNISTYNIKPALAGEKGMYGYPASESYVINQGYLYGEDTGSGYGHTGLDIGSGYSGFPIYAAEAGTIVEVAGPTGAYGNTIVISHGNNTWTRYAHMSSFVRTSGSVTKGELIGYSGSTGNVTGPHLHFEVMINSNNYYNVVNPEMFLARSDSGYGCVKGQVKDTSTSEWLAGVRIAGLYKGSPDSNGYGASYTYLRNSAGNWPLDITTYSINYHVARCLIAQMYTVTATKSLYNTGTYYVWPQSGVTTTLNMNLLHS